MISSIQADVTQLLHRIGGGDGEAQESLLEILYSDLHSRASGAMQGQPAHHTLQATALVNEAYIKLMGAKDQQWRDRSHFLSLAAKAMRQVLVDHARGKNRDKRLPAHRQVALDQACLIYSEGDVELLDLDDALLELATFDPQMARAVDMRYFGGMTMQETADCLGISRHALEHRWRNTRLWLRARADRD